jgi:tetratricopeptide (TPR) repeat protein
VLAPLVLERARRLKAGRPRRLLFWAIAELHNELGELAKAADLYAKASDGLDDEDGGDGDALLLACRRSRALCLARLGFRTEAEDEYDRYRNVASDYPDLLWAHMEKRLGDTQAAFGHFCDSYKSYSIAYNIYRRNRRPRMTAESIMGWGQAEMQLGKAKDAADSFRIARRFFDFLDDQYGVTRADQCLGEAYKLWGKPDEQLDAARRAFENLERYGELHSAASSLADCADAAARLGDVAKRDSLYEQAFKLLVKAAADERDGPARSAVRAQAAQLRLEYAEYLVDDDESYSRALDQVRRAVGDLRSLREVGARRLGRALHAVGRARRALEGSVRRTSDPGPTDSPPSREFRLLPFDSPALLMHLGVCMDPN